MIDPLTSNGNYLTAGSDAAIDDIFDGGGTVTAWVTTQGAAAFGYIASKQNSSPAAGWGFLHNGSYQLGFEYQFSGANYCFWRTTQALSTSTRHHVAVVYDADSNTNDPVFYIDGVAYATTQTNGASSGTRNSDAAYNARMMTSPSGSSRLRGELGDVRWYTRALSAAEIAAIAAGKGLDNIRDGLVARWFLNDLAPGTVPGASGAKDRRGASHGSPTGSPAYRAGYLKGP